MPSSADDDRPANASAASAVVSGAGAAASGAGVAASGVGVAVSPRQMRRGPAPFASFDHDVSDEMRPDSSPETKLTIHLPEIREDTSGGQASSEHDHGGSRNGDSSVLDVPESQARMTSSPAVPTPGLQAPTTPRIDISRASSSSHHDSRESSPDMAFPSELAFREEGALDLRSSTEELAFLEGVPGQEANSKSPAIPSHPIAATAPCSRRHSRKDSQGSEVVMLGVFGRSSRLSSVGSQCSALSRLSGLSRSPSPHRMLVETSFCGPRPIDNDPDTCERKVLEMARISSDRRESAPAPLGIVSSVVSSLPVAPSTSSASIAVRADVGVEINPISTPTVIVDNHKQQKELKNQAVATERRRARAKEQRKRSSDIVRIRLKPDDQYDDDDVDDIEVEESRAQPVSKPVTLELKSRDVPLARTPSPAMGTPQRKASFCSLFRSSPESPASGARRKKSLTEGRPRSSSSSRERSSGLRGSVLSLFRSSRKSSISPPPPSFTAQPPIPMKKITPAAPTPKLKYYEKSVDGIIHIPLHSPPDEPKTKATSTVTMKVSSVLPGSEASPANSSSRPLSATSQKSALKRTVLPDGSIIIPLHSPTEKTIDHDAIELSMSPDYEDVKEQARALRTYEAPEIHTVASPILHSKETEVIATIENCEPKRNKITKQHVVFSTKMECGDQVFSTQLSVTKTPSLCSDMSVEMPLPLDTEPANQEIDEINSTMTNRTSGQVSASNTPKSEVTASKSELTSPKYGVKTIKSFSKQENCNSTNLKYNNHEAYTSPLVGTSKLANLDLGTTDVGASSMNRADSSGSEGSSEVAFTRRDVEDAEKRGLVLGQESFEDELPYIPTTLPLERPLGVPIVPVRERGDVHVAPVQRPRPPLTATSTSRPKSITKLITTTNPHAEKLRITLPSKTRSGQSQKTPMPRAEWIDFEELPERKKQPKRIQILPESSAGGDTTPGSDECVVYVAPEQCRCDCHHRPANSSSSVECDTEGCTGETETEEANLQSLELRVHIGQPFNTDLDLRQDPSTMSSEQSGRPF